MTIEDKDPWFAPKRFGYGAGWPIAPQGWLLMGGYMVLALGCGWATERVTGPGQAAIFGVFLGATILLIAIAKRRTRGGWRWRWGDGD